MRVVFKHYRLGLILFLIIALAVVGAQFVRPARYKASATLISMAPEYQWRFDTRISPNIEVNKNWQREFLELAKDEWVQQSIARAVRSETGGEINEIEGNVAVVAGKQTLLRVEANDRTPQQAAQLANAWSKAYIALAAKLYGPAGMAASIGDELLQVESVYREALKNLSDFEARTGIGIAAEGQTMLEGYEWLGPKGLELAEKNRILAKHRLAVTNLQMLMQQWQAARQAGRPPKELPWELLDVDPIASRGQLTPAIALSLADAPDKIEALLNSELAVQTQATQALEADVARSQQEIMTLQQEFDRLVQERILARENYNTFRRKVDEIAVQTRVEGVELRLLEEAQPPASPTPPNWTLAGVVALLAGAAVGLAGCFVADYLEQHRQAR